MQNEQEDELLDYNDDPEYTAIHGQPPSHTPTQTPLNLDSEDEKEGEGEGGNGLEEGQEPEENIRAAELTQREK